MKWIRRSTKDDIGRAAITVLITAGFGWLAWERVHKQGITSEEFSIWGSAVTGSVLVGFLALGDLLFGMYAALRLDKKSALEFPEGVQLLTDQASRLVNERDQARSDLEYTQTELGQVAENLAEESKATAVAEARVEELHNQVDQTVGERDNLAAKLAEAEASMGWWTRRKYQHVGR